MTDFPALKFPLGLNNRDRESAVPNGALREAVNLDVTRDGGLLVRNGLREITTGDAHSFYGHPNGEYSLLVIDGELVKFDGIAFTSLRSVHPTARVSYTTLNGEVFFSNGYEQGRITAGGELTFWGLPIPPAPQCSIVENTGGFREGTVRVTIVAVVNGVESGAPEPVALSVSDGSGVLVTVPSGATFNIYSTDVDGDIFYKTATALSGTSVLVGAGMATGKRLESLFAVKPFSGNYLVSYKGRIWIANDQTVWFTDSASPHWLFLHQGYFTFDSAITLLAAAEDGLFIGTATQIWFLQGTQPNAMTLRLVSTYGAIAGSGLSELPIDAFTREGVPLGRCCTFLDTDGVFCVGRPGGQVQRVTANYYGAGNAGLATLIYWQHEGLHQVVAIIEDVAGDENAALDSSVQEVTIEETPV